MSLLKDSKERGNIRNLKMQHPYTQQKMNYLFNVDIADPRLYRGTDLFYEGKKRLISDMSYGFIEFNNFIWDIIDTKHIQRLRNLTQLGSLYHVFPSADFCRFEHSLGVAHMADQFCQKAYENGGNQGLSSGEQDYIRESMMIAGLCHDLGHGPFSHVFDATIIPKIAGTTSWSHEDASVMLMEHMIDTNNLDIEKEQLNFMQGLISGDKRVDYGVGKQKYLF